MDFTPRYPVHSNSESSTTVYASAAEYQINFKAHWPNNMYSTQNLNSLSKQQLLKESTDANQQNYNFGMYSTKHSLSVDNMANQPKKESLWQSVTRSFTNLLGEHLTRGTNSFIKNLNNPLSVTVVSPEIYKSLQQRKQLVNPTEDFCSAGVWKKESHNSVDMLPNILYDNEIISDSVKKIDSDTSDSDKMWNEYKNMYINTNGTIGKNLIKDEKIVNSVNKSDYKNETLESHDILDNRTDIDRSMNFGNTINVDDEPVILEKPESTFETHEEQEQQQQQQQPQQQEQQQQQHHSKVESEQSRMEKPLQESVSTMLSNACNKVVNGVVDLLQLGSTSADADSISFLFTKRACSPRVSRPKKMHNISIGRGRGRAKSQLRRSGVSQTRHRKERSRYDKSDEIKSDIDNWEELEYCSATEDEIEELDEYDFPESEEPRRMRSKSFTLADIKPKKRKSKRGKNCSWGQLSVALSVQSLDSDVRDNALCTEKMAFRRRLLSESSVDSEDSYCIVFEGDDCSDDEETEFETEEESCSESEIESEIESDDHEDESETEFKAVPAKVRFDPKPVVHKMVKWAFAYKAARIGPWEQMGRDRERFSSRIHNIGRILEPVLSQKHRMQVWQERFAD